MSKLRSSIIVASVIFAIGCSRVDDFVVLSKSSLDESLKNQITDAVEQKMPLVGVIDISKTPLDNIYEIRTTKGVFYADKELNWGFIGDLIDINNETNMTNISREILSSELSISHQLKNKSSFYSSLLNNSLLRNNLSPSKGIFVENTIKSVSDSADNQVQKKINNHHLSEIKSNETNAEKHKKIKPEPVNSDDIFGVKDNTNNEPENKINNKTEDLDKKTEEQKVLEANHIDVSDIKSADSFILYKKTKIPKIGFDQSGNQLTEDKTTSQIKKIIQNIKTKGDSWSIKYPAEGEEKQSIIVFSDPTCPYCRKLHQNMKQINKAGVSVYYLFYPRALALGMKDLRSRQVINSMRTIWCEKGGREAMDTIYSGGIVKQNLCDKPEPNNGRGQFPAFEHYFLGELFGINATPLVITEKGKQFYGFTSTEKLLNDLSK